MREKKHENEQTKKVFLSMNVIYEKAIEVNKYPILNVDEQQGDLKHL